MGTLNSEFEALKRLESEFSTDLSHCDDLKALETIRIKYLGKKGTINQYFKRLAEMPVESRAEWGRELNRLKNSFQQELSAKSSALKKQQQRREFVDVSLPGYHSYVGKRHPLTQILDDIKFIFTSMGFTIEEGPEIETDYHNFEALNLPPDHPAREMHDTFYLPGGFLLRTHTSPVQIRVMEKRQPPIRMIAPGRCFRRDTPDASHSPFFHQVEGLCVDENVSFTDLKGVISAFAKKLFGPGVQIRFRPSYFPFTEPSAEYDFSCIFCEGKGCRLCKGTGWLEISGAGMVDPEVFKSVGYDAEKYSGYAFGMGVERLAMLKYQIDDIRLFYENDIRFLDQF